MTKGKTSDLLLMISIVLLGVGLLSCASTTNTPATKNSSTSKPHPTRSISGPANQPVTYSTDAQDVLIRTFYGGGHAGALAFAPQISIYGDGGYILGVDQR